MFKVIITGENNKSWQGTFDTLEIANEWLDRQKLKEGRFPEREEQRLTYDENGEIILDENGQEVYETVTLPAQATYEIVDATHLSQIETLYNTMVNEVYAQMSATFGTNDPNSAVANERTFQLMVTDASSWASIGLVDEEGNALDTEQKVLDFANAKLIAIESYASWRLMRIQTFRQARQAILDAL